MKEKLGTFRNFTIRFIDHVKKFTVSNPRRVEIASLYFENLRQNIKLTIINRTLFFLYFLNDLIINIPSTRPALCRKFISRQYMLLAEFLKLRTNKVSFGTRSKDHYCLTLKEPLITNALLEVVM